MPSDTAPHPSPADQADAADLRAEDALYYRSVLHEFIDIGTELARAVRKQAAAETDEPASMTLGDAAVAFDRLSRAVRRTVALARKVAEPVPARADAGSERTRAAARRRILRDVEDVIQREAEGADVDVLEAELRERLDGPELDDEIDGRPTAEVIADICHDLGLLTFLGNHPWKRRGPADIAALCERAARPAGADRPAPGPAAAWAGPKPYSREASIELMHQLLEHAPPLPPDGGNGLGTVPTTALLRATRFRGK